MAAAAVVGEPGESLSLTFFCLFFLFFSLLPPFFNNSHGLIRQFGSVITYLLEKSPPILIFASFLSILNQGTTVLGSTSAFVEYVLHTGYITPQKPSQKKVRVLE